MDRKGGISNLLGSLLLQTCKIKKRGEGRYYRNTIPFSYIILCVDRIGQRSITAGILPASPGGPIIYTTCQPGGLRKRCCIPGPCTPNLLLYSTFDTPFSSLLSGLYSIRGLRQRPRGNLAIIYATKGREAEVDIASVCLFSFFLSPFISALPIGVQAGGQVGR